MEMVIVAINVIFFSPGLLWGFWCIIHRQACLDSHPHPADGGPLLDQEPGRAVLSLHGGQPLHCRCTAHHCVCRNQLICVSLVYVIIPGSGHFIAGALLASLRMQLKNDLEFTIIIVLGLFYSTDAPDERAKVYSGTFTVCTTLL